MDTTQAASLRTKLSFWLLLGVLSVAVAEVSVGSAPFAFVNPVETVFLTVFYGSHLLVVAWLAFRRGWPTLTALWLGGVLFGLYEFYITKVLWAPPWGDTISLGHIDVVALIVLVFFWHPFMAFVFPLSIAETVGTRSRSVARQLPDWFTSASPRKIILAGIIAALTHGLLMDSPGVALISTASALTAIGLATWWWRRGSAGTSWTLRELLPNDRQGKAVAIVLLGQYLLLSPLMNAADIPPMLGHVIVWLLYGGFGLLFWSAGRESTPSAQVAPSHHKTWPTGRLIQWAGALLVLSALGSLGQPGIGYVIVWLGAIIVGLRMLIGTLRHMLRPQPASRQRDDHDGDPAHRL